MNTKGIQAVFWAPALRSLSSADLGTAVETKAEAFDELLTRIITSNGIIRDFNEAYDLFPVEFEQDHLTQIKVEDRYTVCFLYASAASPGGSPAASLRTEPEEPGEEPCGMLYAPKRSEGPEWHFREYLERLKERVQKEYTAPNAKEST